ncbi:hypothetical protein VTO42DRAFT_7233 [Malbranchea cinnamomea]
MSRFPIRQWTRRARAPSPSGQSKCEGTTLTDREFLVSTDPARIPIADLIDAFGQDFVYWGNPLPEAEMRRLVEASLCFALYVKVTGENVEESAVGHANNDSTQQQQRQYRLIGFARLITDCITFGYLTDFYVLPEYQGLGLGTWMLKCLEEVLDGWPHLRRFLLLTRSERSKRYYEKLLGMQVVAEPQPSLYYMVRGGPAMPF